MPLKVDKLIATEIVLNGTELKPSYKVYTALLTQSGGSNEQFANSDTGTLTIGVTYLINDNLGGDFTNVGAPNNNNGTYFVATGTTPNAWGGGGSTLIYDTGAPVVTVLENTIGNVWWTYESEGFYNVNSNGLFTIDKTYTVLQLWGDDNLSPRLGVVFRTSNSILELFNRTFDGTSTNKIGETSSGWLTSIEIRVYN